MHFHEYVILCNIVLLFFYVDLFSVTFQTHFADKRHIILQTVTVTDQIMS